MSESTSEEIAVNVVEQLRQNFADEEYRNAYVESFLNSYVAAQIKVLREDYPLTQAELAEKVGTQQPGIARLENVNYSAWKVETLRKVARALGVRLKITFEEWGTLPDEIEHFNRQHLMRVRFERDPVFSPALERPSQDLGSAETIEVRRRPTRDELGMLPRIPVGSVGGDLSQFGAAAQSGT